MNHECKTLDEGHFARRGRAVAPGAVSRCRRTAPAQRLGQCFGARQCQRVGRAAVVASLVRVPPRVVTFQAPLPARKVAPRRHRAAQPARSNRARVRPRALSSRNRQRRAPAITSGGCLGRPAVAAGSYGECPAIAPGGRLRSAEHLVRESADAAEHGDDHDVRQPAGAAGHGDERADHLLRESADASADPHRAINSHARRRPPRMRKPIQTHTPRAEALTTIRPRHLLHTAATITPTTTMTRRPRSSLDWS